MRLNMWSVVAGSAAWLSREVALQGRLAPTWASHRSPCPQLLKPPLQKHGGHPSWTLKLRSSPDHQERNVPQSPSKDARAIITRPGYSIAWPGPGTGGGLSGQAAFPLEGQLGNLLLPLLPSDRA